MWVNSPLTIWIFDKIVLACLIDWLIDLRIDWLLDCLNSQGNSMPEPKSMLEVTIEVNNLVSLASAKELYTASMESLCGGDRWSSSIYLSWLPQKHKCYQVTTPPGNPVPLAGEITELAWHVQWYCYARVAAAIAVKPQLPWPVS